MWYATINEYGYLVDYGPFTCKRKAKHFARWWMGKDNIFSIFKSNRSE